MTPPLGGQDAVQSESMSWRTAWQRTADAVQAHGGDVQAFVVSSPASEAEIRSVEERLGRRLPSELRDTLQTFAASVHLRWKLRQITAVGAPLRRITHGELHWDLAALVGHEESREGWAELHDAPEDSPAWTDKLAFQRAANGDLLAIDLVAPGNPVVYLDHDAESSLHGRVLAPGFKAFVARWSAVGCIGPESWELAPFLGGEGIDPNGGAARIWAAWREGS